MEKTQYNQDISYNGRLVFLINRDTGEILIYDHYFYLDFQSNIVFQIENNTITPVVFGRFDNNLWHFRGLGIMNTHKDPFVAACKVLYYGQKYKMLTRMSRADAVYP